MYFVQLSEFELNKFSVKCLKELCSDNFQIKQKHISKTSNPRISKKIEAVPCQKVEIRDCDEVPDDYHRAGIGNCFKGKTV